MVAQSRVSDRDGPIRIVASGKRAVSALGLLPRSATGTASSSATGGEQAQLGTSRQLLDSALVDRDHGSHQPGMDLLPLQLSAPGRQMLAAVLSPASYLSHFLSGSLYLL